MKVGIITFHASHNYGSMLQAYALQKTVQALGHRCEIIDFRPERQREIYRPFPLEPRLLTVAKTLRFPKLALDDLRRFRLFEKFIRESLQVTRRKFADSQQLGSFRFDYDAYISGSDQIWNTGCRDHSPAYFLNFVTDAVKIAYATSMGPRPETEVRKSDDPDIGKYLSTYRALSVREEGTADRIARITGKCPPVCLDPTLLLPRNDWQAMTADTSHIPGDYLLLYSPFYDEPTYDQALELAERHRWKVVVTLPHSRFRFRKNRRMEFHTAVGPKEFLTLVKFAKFVVCKSFHGVIFSLIFSRPFYAVDGMEDNRVAYLLQSTELEFLAEYPDGEMPALPPETFSRAFALLQPLKEQSVGFLQNALSRENGHRAGIYG